MLVACGIELGFSHPWNQHVGGFAEPVADDLNPALAAFTVRINVQMPGQAVGHHRGDFRPLTQVQQRPAFFFFQIPWVVAAQHGPLCCCRLLGWIPGIAGQWRQRKAANQLVPGLHVGSPNLLQCGLDFEPTGNVIQQIAGLRLLQQPGPQGGKYHHGAPAGVVFAVVAFVVCHHGGNGAGHAGGNQCGSVRLFCRVFAAGRHHRQLLHQSHQLLHAQQGQTIGRAADLLNGFRVQLYRQTLNLQTQRRVFLYLGGQIVEIHLFVAQQGVQPRPGFFQYRQAVGFENGVPILLAKRQ